jgi:RNA polymerase sigma-70 factor (ECF subfamily)
LNRAIALAEWKGPDAGLAALEAIEAPSWLLGYYLWDATLGELHRRRGDRDRALAHTQRALAGRTDERRESLARTAHEKMSSQMFNPGWPSVV